MYHRLICVCYAKFKNIRGSGTQLYYLLIL